MQKSRAMFILNTTEDLHNEITEAYENLMDEENEKAIEVLDRILIKTRSLKDDLVIKED